MSLSTGKIFISIPHCSTEIPLQIKGRIHLTDMELKRDTDLFTDQLFELKEFPTLKASYSRYVVDLNRARDLTGEKGVIVTTDFDLRPIYDPLDIPTAQEREERLKKYWDPYHLQLERILQEPSIQFFLDCHSMHPVGSAKAPDPGEERADIVLGNLGTTTGKIRAEIGYLSCPWEWLLKAAGILEELWRPGPLEIAFNDPYYGGYITQHYSDLKHPYHKMSFQIEVNRKLYLDWETQQPLSSKINQIRQVVRKFLERWVSFLKGT